MQNLDWMNKERRKTKKRRKKRHLTWRSNRTRKLENSNALRLHQEKMIEIECGLGLGRGKLKSKYTVAL